MQFFTQKMAVSRQKLPFHPPLQNPSLSFDLPAAGRKAAQRRLSSRHLQIRRQRSVGLGVISGDPSARSDQRERRKMGWMIP
ncbi:hypothetical protein ATCC53582_02941 [Novacetimonas hansenii]|nr:hypothetical protein ATCC53582_02881 [Novacetimonas hansenii]CUW48752.1 hypothetical protein ATCC53582_02899 [Novacetimonas hansenii]CUW48794.1 hypothetical protein ATCC53582_02941 [Novacetimonas hansenii]